MEKLKITRRHQGKMRGLTSINTSPLGNPYCDRMSKTRAVCRHCYSRKKLEGPACRAQAEACQRAWEFNGKILSDADINVYIPKITKSPVRLHSHGELINRTHLARFIEICEKNTNVQFVLWTKRFRLVQSYLKNHAKPNNLILIYSEPKINREKPIVPKGFDKVFAVYTPSFVEKNNININCGSRKCAACMLCYEVNDVKIIRELIK